MTPLLISGGSVVTLVILVSLYVAEDKKEELLVLAAVRQRMDILLTTLLQHCRHFMRVHVWQRCQVIGHYIIHTVLHILWFSIKKVDGMLKALIKQNRERVAHIRARQEKNHLDVIADHKVESRLSEQERSKRLSLD